MVASIVVHRAPLLCLLCTCVSSLGLSSGRTSLSAAASRCTLSSSSQSSSDINCLSAGYSFGRLPQYGVGSIDLTERWLQLVQGGKVVSTAQISDPDVLVRYGIRTVNTKGNDDNSSDSIRCAEFAHEIADTDANGDSSQQQDEQDIVNRHPLVQQINATLSRLQSASASLGSSPSSQYAVQYRRVGPYAAQLQLVRTLRPPPSAGFAASGADKTTCNPPAYDASADSFVTGPYRLELRPLVGSIPIEEIEELSTDWSIYHNVSPADSRGHFLLIPTLSDAIKNWRGQILTQSDCKDIVALSKTVQPAGSTLISYNSVGAGASQNHIHLHLWPSPPIPLLDIEDNDDDGQGVFGWRCYAVTKANSVSTMIYSDEVLVSLLDYPVCCIKLSSSSIIELGRALGIVVGIVQTKFNSPHNVGLLNRDDGVVDAYVFVRSRERSPRIVPGSRSGSSEMMGVFHTSSEDQLNELTFNDEGFDGVGRAMETVLRDVSYEPREEVWTAIQSDLLKAASQ